MKHRILVVEDHAVVRDGLIALINRAPDLEVCASADSASSALQAIDRHQPELVIADLMLKEGNGLELIKQARASHPNVLFLIISMQEEELYAERCIKAGASGYITKHAATDEFMDAIQIILGGEIYLSKKMNARLLRRLADRKIEHARDDLGVLTDRELQVFQMIGAGMNTREIAPALGISPKTVATHRENIKLKLGFKDGRALLQAAMKSMQG
ncbi:MAG TPA: response regulator transcription factor [Kiritimatiellia bacterium]|nr:response regulator transcription factor [Kiritimatiellia bacterium]HMP00363.1 response regulator transcription factor [Kiritimatiellia bacterium]HMP97801.1 response regulator transcription factor [Kiritimatiellia bacterium]